MSDPVYVQTPLDLDKSGVHLQPINYPTVPKSRAATHHALAAARRRRHETLGGGLRVEHVVQKQVAPQPVTRAMENRSGLIFAAKTTASGLIALLVAFTFNLDEPYWALLTVFIVAQPRQSGQVFAKSFYRMVGTVIGAAVALLFVGLFAQERVLFLGGLAIWIGVCAFGSQCARNFAAYSFILSGYTVAIVGIPGALDAGNAFYIATGRVTEACLGIIAAATVNRIVLPSSLEHAAAEQHIVEMGDDGIGVVGLRVERHRGEHDPGQPAEHEDEENPSTNSSGVLNCGRP